MPKGNLTPGTPNNKSVVGRPKSQAGPLKHKKEDEPAKSLGIPADLDINVLLQRLISLQEARANRLEGDDSEPVENDVRIIAQFLFAPDKVQPAPSQSVSKLKANT